jgi:hypothetical protein
VAVGAGGGAGARYSIAAELGQPYADSVGSETKPSTLARIVLLPRFGITNVPETVGPDDGPLATTCPPTETV